jgi:hypothetical protein
MRDAFRPWVWGPPAWVLLLAALASTAAAQTKTGTTFGAFMLIEPSARAAAMGNAGVTLSDEVLAAYFNPAAAAYHDRFALQFTHSPWFADITYDHVAAALPIGGYGVGFASVTALNSGDIEVRTVGQPLGTGELYHVSDVALGLGFGRQVTDRFAMGLQVHYLQEDIWNSSAYTMTLDLGTLYRIADNGLVMGASISNYGTQARYSGRDLRVTYDLDPDRFGDNGALPAEGLTDPYSVPVLFRIGLGLPIRLNETSRLHVAVDGLHPSDATESLNGGLEWSYREMFALRAGFQNAFLQDREGGMRLGAGLQQNVRGTHVRADYAWADHGRLGDTHRVTLGVSY